MTENKLQGLEIDDSQLNKVSGGINIGKKPERKAKCPQCREQTLVIKYKRLECQNCGYIEPM